MAEVLTLIGLEIRAEKARAELARLDARLKKTEGRFDQTKNSAKQLTATSGALAAKVGVLAAGFVGLHSALRLGRELVGTITRFEQLEARLATLTGSLQAGGRAFEELVEFSRETPFSIDQTVKAFSRLRAVGIVPTTALLRQLGNFASAQASDIESVAAAAVQASFAETERLKNLGVSAQVSATEIRLAYDGIERSIVRTGSARRDTEQILGFLTDLASSRWGDAMSQQANFVGTAASNLRGEWSLLLRDIGEVGAADTAATSMRALTAVLASFRVAVAAAQRAAEPFFRGAFRLGSEPLDLSPGEFVGPLQTPEAPAAPTAQAAEAAISAAERQAQALRAVIVELSLGSEAAVRYRLATEGATDAEIEQVLALGRVRDALQAAEAAEVESARALVERKNNIEDALEAQRRYLIGLQHGARGLAALDFDELAPDAAQVERWLALTSAIRQTEAASMAMALAQDEARESMRQAESRAHDLQSAVERLLNTFASGRNIFAEVARLLTGIAVQSLSTRISDSLAASLPVGLLGRGAPAPAPAPVVNFSQTLAVSTIDARGVGEFLRQNAGGIGAVAVEAIKQSGDLRLGVR